MDIAERIDDVVCRRNHFAVNIYQGTKNSPHSGMQLDDRNRFHNYSINDGCLGLPYIQRNSSQLEREQL
jgi:hypothetical protein